MKKAEISSISCQTEVNNPGFSRIVAYHPFDGLNADECMSKSSYEFISIPTNESTLKAAKKFGPYVLTNTKRNTLKLYHVAAADFSAEDKADAKFVCSYAKLTQAMSAAATYEQHLLVGDEGGVVYLFNIPDSGAWGASEKLRPSTTYHEHQSTIMACDMSAKHSVTGEKNGKVNCWILGQEAPVWTVNTKEQIFDVRFTSSNKVVVLTNDGKLNLHFQVIDQGEILFDQRYFYDNKCFDFAYADELKINSLERVSAVNFSLGKLGILDVSDPQKPTTRSMNHSYKIEGKSEPGKRLMLFSRDSFFCVLKKCKAQKNWRLTICKNDAQDSEIEYPKKTL